MEKLLQRIFDREYIDKPYNTNIEYLYDLAKIIDIKIVYYLEHTDRIKNKYISPLDKFKGLVISKEEIENIIATIKNNDDKEEYPDITAIIKEAEEFIEARKRLTLKRGIFLPIDYIFLMFKLTDFEKHCLVLSLLPHLDRKYEKVFGYIQDDVTVKSPTVDIAIKLYGGTDNELEKIEYYILLQKKLLKIFFDRASNKENSNLSKPLKLDDRMLAFLLEGSPIHENVEEYIDFYFPNKQISSLIINEDINDKIMNYIKVRQKHIDNTMFFYIYGPLGSGKRLLVKHFAKQYESSVLFVNAKKLYHTDIKEMESRLDKIYREAILQEAFVAFYNYDFITGLSEDKENYINKILRRASDLSGIVFILSKEEWKDKASSKDYEWFEIELKIPDRIDRIKIWNVMAENYPFEGDFDFSQVANKFLFTPGQIHNSLMEAHKFTQWTGNEFIDQGALYKGCYSQVVHNLKDKAGLVYAQSSWDDLILPKGQKDMLANACDQIRYKHIVYDRWGFDKKLAYGKGISMLFAGPPGTGKTMAAQVVAKELNLEIYKVDLSQIVSKYIGETEKNLKEIFEAGIRSNVILFFDETDALLGKRTEVKDSHDRNANLETSYLLQKIEEYEGITIMATNYLENIDTAFIRRISYIIHFPYPDATLREQIWRNIFPKAAPLDESIDYKYLARQFELSGGNIKNIAISSAFMAAKHNEKIQMKHLLLAIKYELVKQDKVLIREDFGEYGFLFNDKYI